MPELADLDLPYLPLDEPGFSDDPVPHFVAARRRHPWLARCSVGYVVTEHKAMREIMRHDAALVMGFNEIVEIMGATGTPWGDFIAGTIQVQSGAVHQRLRAAIHASFTPGEADRYRSVMREEIERLLDEWLPKGAFDFEEFISHFPITVLCRMIGASPEVIPQLRASLEALGLAFSMDRKYLPELQRGMGVLYDCVHALVADRRAGKRPAEGADLLDQLLEVRDAGQMDDAELYNLLIFLFGGGYDTSKNVLTLIMYNLLDRPDLYRRCAESPEFCRRVMNETFRFNGPSTATRKVVADIVVRDVRFPAGTLIMFPWSVSGRDETAVEDPHVYDPDRPGVHNHFAFGLGAHMCLGQFIARAQIEEGLHVIARRLLAPRLAGEVRWRPFPGVWGIHGLPIAFDAPRSAAQA
jgi:cytochrome P450